MTSIPRMCKPRFLTALLLYPLLFALHTEAAASIDDRFGKALGEEGLSGAVWSTATPEDGIETGAAGIKHAATGERMTNATRTQTGSVTKVVVAIGVLHLVTEGKLSLDADVAKLLPQLEFDNPWAASHPVTVRHLLDHTAGLENFRLSQLFSQRASPTAPLAENILVHEGLLRVRMRPGRNYAYSNTGYILLAMVIEAVTGQPYERYMDQSVLAPLGMHDSTFAYRTQQGADADLALAMGHLDGQRPYPVTPSFMRPVEQFATTAGDMAASCNSCWAMARLMVRSSSIRNCWPHWGRRKAPRPPATALKLAMDWHWQYATATASSAPAIPAARWVFAACCASIRSPEQVFLWRSTPIARPPITNASTAC